MKKNNGFTLIEILISLFIFTILSLLLIGGLRNVINAQSGTENKAQRLRQLQISLLMMSRDIEQTVNRPIVNSSGKEEAAFVGSPTSFVLTHTGFANPTNSASLSTLQRSGYEFKENVLSRLTWDVLDQAPKTKPLVRNILENVTNVKFEYLDQHGRFHEKWPTEADASVTLPRGVKINLNIENWGTLTQFYLIAAQDSISLNKNENENENGDKNKNENKNENENQNNKNSKDENSKSNDEKLPKA